MSGFKPGSTLAPEPSTLTTEALNEAWKRGYKVAQEEAALASSAPASAPEPSEAIAQLRHLIDDLVVTYQEDGLERHMVRDGAGLLFSNFVGAVRRLLASLPASPEPATQGAAKPVHTDHPFQHWDRTCPACVLEASPPVPNSATQGAAEPVKYTRDFGDYATEDVMAWIDAELARCDAPMGEGLPYIPADKDVGDALRWLRANLFGISAASPAPEPLTPAAYAIKKCTKCGAENTK